MRDRMERIVILPFTLGCVSESSVAAVSLQHYPKRSKVDPKPFTSGVQEEEEEESFSGISIKSALALLNRQKTKSSPGLLRLFKGLKSISQLLYYKEEIEEHEMEMEMEIGLPTDVKHVTHIGVDGSATTHNIKSKISLENLMN